MKTLYITDLDGTLLRSDKSLSQYTVDTINGFIAAGGLFTCATARSFHSAGPLVAALDIRLPLILFNGTFIADAQTGENIHACTLPREALDRVMAVYAQHGAHPLVHAYVDGKERVSWLAGMESGGVREYIRERQGDPRQRPVTTPQALTAGDVFYITLIDTQARTARMEALLADIPGISVQKQEDTYQPDTYWLEITSLEAGKDKAIERLQRLLGIERVVCFGDNLNDLSMFSTCDAGYAVENALPVLKAAATGIIGSNDGDGVARYLESIQ